MVVNLRPSRRSGHFTSAGSSNPLHGSSSSPHEAVVAPTLPDPFALSAMMNPDNVHSPLFLHSVDHPGLMIVSVQLDGLNNTQWRSAMKIALDARTKSPLLTVHCLALIQVIIFFGSGLFVIAWLNLGFSTWFLSRSMVVFCLLMMPLKYGLIFTIAFTRQTFHAHFS